MRRWFALMWASGEFLGSVANVASDLGPRLWLSKSVAMREPKQRARKPLAFTLRLAIWHWCCATVRTGCRRATANGGFSNDALGAATLLGLATLAWRTAEQGHGCVRLVPGVDGRRW